MERTTDTGGPDDVLESLKNLVVANGDAVSRFGARLVVQCKFIDAVLSQLSAMQCGRAARLFRNGIEEALSFTDDVAMPGGYHETLLEETNSLLKALETRSVSLR